MPTATAPSATDTGFYLEVIQHGEDAEQFVIGVDADEFEALRTYGGDGFLFDGLYEHPPFASREERALVESVLNDKIWTVDHADLRPSEIAAARRASHLVTVESYV